MQSLLLLYSLSYAGMIVHNTDGLFQRSPLYYIRSCCGGQEEDEKTFRHSYLPS